MHLRKNSDQGFDDFIRERKRARAKAGPQASVLGYENQALRELEQVEAREVREQQLSREVHDFFAAATRQAAAIVEKVAHDAEQEAGQRLQGEVEGFLMDALSRMNNFILTVMQKRRNVNVAETQVEPHLGHLVGPGLDAFRYEGAEETRDLHLGQDPFDVEVEDVQREFRAVVADMEGRVAQPAPIEEHLVAEATEEPSEEPAEEAPPEEPADDEAAPEAPAARAPAPSAEEVVAAAAEVEQKPSPEQELETFKNALKALVRQGIMQRDEARAAWQARLASMGRA